MKSLIIVFFIQFMLLSSFASLTFAEENQKLDIKNELINPGSFYYPLKRFGENATELFMFTDSAKYNFHKSLLNTRASELKYVVENRVLSEIERSSQRFAYQAGILEGRLKAKRNQEEKDKIIKEFDQYQKLFDELRDHFPANSSFWMLLQHDINTLKILTQKIQAK